MYITLLYLFLYKDNHIYNIIYIYIRLVWNHVKPQPLEHRTWNKCNSGGVGAENPNSFNERTSNFIVPCEELGRKHARSFCCACQWLNQCQLPQLRSCNLWDPSVTWPNLNKAEYYVKVIFLTWSNPKNSIL